LPLTWEIHVRNKGEGFIMQTYDFAHAIGMATVLLRDGIDISGIKGPNDLCIGIDQISPLFEKP
jgi:hypothetical protein